MPTEITVAVAMALVTCAESEIPVLHQTAKCSQLLNTKLYFFSPSREYARSTVSSAEYKLYFFGSR